MVHYASYGDAVVQHPRALMVHRPEEWITEAIILPPPVMRQPDYVIVLMHAMMLVPLGIMAFTVGFLAYWR